MDEVSGAIRFPAAFTAIENHFTWKLQTDDDRTGFVRMAEDYARRHHTRLDLPALRAFADLRNARNAHSRLSDSTIRSARSSRRSAGTTTRSFPSATTAPTAVC
ncbi:hypothetical protein [Rhodococcus aetherivorans]